MKTITRKSTNIPALQTFRTLCALSLLFALGMGAGDRLHAAVYTWTGAGSSNTGTNWSDANNWLGGGAPASGNSLEFGMPPVGGGTGLNDNGQMTSISNITWDAGTAYTFNGSTITLSGSLIQNSSFTQTINNNVSWNLNNSTTLTDITGVGGIVFSGTTSGLGQSSTFIANDTFNQFYDFILSTTTGGRNYTFEGSANLILNAVSTNSGATTTQQMNYLGTGTMILSSANNGGMTGVAGVGVGVQIADGKAFTSPTTDGNSNLLVQGTYTIGLTAGNGFVTIKGGNGVATTGSTQGTLSMEDGSINTLFINSASGQTGLTMGQSSTAQTILSMDVGNGSADSIVLSSGVKSSVGASGVKVNLNGLGQVASGTYVLINSASGLSTTGFVLNNITSGNWSGYNTVTLVETSGTLSVAIPTSGANPTPGNAYWSGTQGAGGTGTWNSFSSGTLNYSNWLNAPAGTDTNQAPGATTNVFFSATTNSNLTTYLGQNFTINSLNFTSATPAVSVSGSIPGSGNNYTLQINATNANSNTAGSGITVASGAAAPTINANVILGASQTWTISNATSAPLTVNGAISGSGGGSEGLTVAGSGELVLGGNNTFTGGLTIGNATVLLSNTGALNGGTPNSVTFASSSSGALNLNGNNVTVTSLATNLSVVGTPVVQNGATGSGTATLTVDQSGTSTFAGTLRDGGNGGLLAYTESGAGTQILSGNNTYSGSTIVANGVLEVNGSLGAGSGVSVAAAANNTTAILAGSGTINGPVTISGSAATNALSVISPSAEVAGSAGTTLTLKNGLTMGTGAIAYFNITNNGPADFINITNGGLIATGGTGSIDIRVTSTLTTTGVTYNLIGGTGLSNTNDFVFQSLTGSPLGSSYAFTMTSGTLQLTIQGASAADPTIYITTPTANTRVMTGFNVALSGSITNTGPFALSGSLSSTGALTFTPTSSPVSVGANSVNTYGGTVATTGSGSQSVGITVTDGNASPMTSNVSENLDVVQNRTVTASSVNFGSVHSGSTVSGATTLSTTGDSTHFTSVTVSNTSADSGGNGLTASGGTGPTFNGASVTDSRNIGGTLNTVGALSGSVTLTTVAEGLANEVPINVGVVYTGNVFSGTAAWSSASSGNWSPNGNWKDLAASDLGNPGAPGLAGALSANDTATFGDVNSTPTSITVSLNGVSPTLIGLTFNSGTDTYTIAPGTPTTGSIVLNGASVPINVSTTLSPTISAVLSGTGLNKTGTGLLILGGSNTYTGATTISNGTIQTTVTNSLPTTTALTLGDGGVNSGQLVLGSGATAANQTLAGLATAGSGAGNSIVGGATATGTLTASIASGTTTFAGTLGGAGTNQNNLAFVKTGGGTLILSGNDTYTGGTELSNGTLGLGSANAIGTAGTITFNNGTLQFNSNSSGNTTDYSSRFAVISGANYGFDTGGANVTLATALPVLGSNAFTKTGLGTLTLTASQSWTGNTNISQGGLVTTNTLPSSAEVKLSAPNGTTYPSWTVWTINSATPLTYTPTMGATLTWGANAGFAAETSALTINVSAGAQQFWNVGNFMSSGEAPMVFGSAVSNAQVNFQNSFDFGSTTATLSTNFNRVIDVEGAAATIVGGQSTPYGVSGNNALLSGVITANTAIVSVPPASPTAGDEGNNGFDKDGPGTLILSNNNTFSGVINVLQGTIIAGTNSMVGQAGAFGDGHTVVVNGTNEAGTQAVILGFANVNGSDGTTATGGSPTVLIGGAFNIQVPITINNVATTGTYGIGGSTDATGTFSGLITANENFNITQVATTGADALDITSGITGGAATTGVRTVNFANAGAVNVSGNIVDGPGGGNIAVTQSGTGVTTLSGTDTYTGATTVNAGKLRVTGTVSASAVTVTPNPGTYATLAGNGSIGGAVVTSSTSASVGVAHIAPGVNTSNGGYGYGNNFGGAGTLTLGAGLTIGDGTNLDFDLGSSGSDLIAVTGVISLGNHVVLNVDPNGTVSLGTTYTLITYTGAQPSDANLARWTSTYLPSGATVATFSDTGNSITVKFTSGNDSALAITPSPISLGNVLVGFTPSNVSGTISNSGVTSSGTFTTVTTGSATATPASGTVAPGSSTTVSVGASSVGTRSGNNVVVGTVAATNTGGGSSAPSVNVTANVYQAFSGSTSTTINSGTSATLNLTNLANTDGAGGQRAGVTITGFSTTNSNFVVTVDNSGTVGNATGGANSATVDVGTATVSPAALSGTYSYTGSITGSASYTDPTLQSQGGGSITNPIWAGVTLSGTVTGATSSGTGQVRQAAVSSGSSYAGYGLTSSVAGGNGTVATLLAGTASGNSTLKMAFSSTGAFGEGGSNPFISGDILTLSGVNPIGGNGPDGGSILTDTFVLQLSYVPNVNNLQNIYYIAWWDPAINKWVNAIAGNSNAQLGRDYIGSGAFVGTYAQYLATAPGAGGGNGLTLDQQLGAFGYVYNATDPSQDVVWAVLDHNSDFAPIPEPGTYAMIFSGFGMLVGFQRMRRKTRKE